MQSSCLGSDVQNDVAPCASLNFQSMLVIRGIQIGDMCYFYSIFHTKGMRSRWPAYHINHTSQDPEKLSFSIHIQQE